MGVELLQLGVGNSGECKGGKQSLRFAVRVQPEGSLRATWLQLALPVFVQKVEGELKR